MIDSRLINPFRVPEPNTISTDLPISLNDLDYLRSYLLDFIQPMSLQNSEAIQVNADPVSNITSN